MLYEAAFWRPDGDRPPQEEALASADLRPYIEGWPRDGDVGVLAVDGSERVGAAWFRLFLPDEPGRGFISAEIPEISIAVVAHRRGGGIGGELLSRLVERGREVGLAALSLSVEPDNRAVVLYRRLGFAHVGIEGGAWTMRLDLS
jgi:GNAT superfamily N-acetyltransferase